MKYIISYEVCSLLFLCLVMANYFPQKKLPNLQNAVFSIMMVVGFVAIILDIVTAFTISYAYMVPNYINYILNSLFYAIQHTTPVIVYVYILIILGLLHNRSVKKVIVTLIPYFIMLFFIIFNVFTKNIFYIKDGIYQHGKGFYILYPISFIYFLISFILILIYKNKIDDKQTIVTCSYVILTVVFMMIQYLYPKYLLSGVSFSLSLCMMYLALQDSSSILDPLTKVFNRAGLALHLKYLISKNSKIQIVTIAVDEMKVINSIFGVKFGDKILVEIAGEIKKYAETGLVFRNMNDEFAVVFNKKSKQSENLVGNLIKRFQQPFIVNDINIKISACIGVLPNTSFAITENDLITMLENMVSLCKKTGKGSVVYLDKANLMLIQREIAIENALRRSLIQNSLYVDYQPIYSLEKQKFIGAEALVRIYDSVLGKISPAEFIPIAEKNGMILTVGSQVLEKVVKYINRENLCHKYDLEFIDVNLSVAELMQENLVENVKDILQRNNINSNFLRFEVTESISTANKNILINTMQLLEQQGIYFALDDFGTGYSNLNSVLQLPFTTIKIDKSMMLSSIKDEKTAKMMAGIVKIITDMGKECIVEGVETQGQLLSVIKMGIKNVQGYYYSAPLDEKKFISFLSENKK